MTTDTFKRDPASLVRPASIEKQTLDVLLRIETLLASYIADDSGPVFGPDGKPLDLASVVDKIEPTPTPFSGALGKKRKGK